MEIIICYSFLIISLIYFPSLGRVEATDYEVGDVEEWSSSVNYLIWSEKYNFTIGDVLVFNYVKGQHDVYEVTQGTFRSCDTSTGVINIYNSGRDRVTLTEAKSYWFICNVAGHCLGGMKFGVNVKTTNATATATTQPKTPSPTSEPIPKNGASIHKIREWKWVCNLLAFWVLTLFITNG